MNDKILKGTFSKVLVPLREFKQLLFHNAKNPNPKIVIKAFKQDSMILIEGERRRML